MPKHVNVMEDFTFHPALHGFAPHQSNLSPITHHPSFHHLNHFFAVQTRFRGLQLRNGGQFQAALQAAKKLVSLLHSCLVWPAWQQATARKLCTFVDIQFIQSEVRPQGCSLPKIDKIFLPFIHTDTHTHILASQVGVEVAGQADDPAGPSAASLSKARYKLDLMLMVNRREFWKKHPYQDHFIALGFFAASFCRVEWIVDRGHG